MGLLLLEHRWMMFLLCLMLIWINHPRIPFPTGDFFDDKYCVNFSTVRKHDLWEGMLLWLLSLTRVLSLLKNKIEIDGAEGWAQIFKSLCRCDYKVTMIHLNIRMILVWYTGIRTHHIHYTTYERGVQYPVGTSKGSSCKFFFLYFFTRPAKHVIVNSGAKPTYKIDPQIRNTTCSSELLRYVPMMCNKPSTFYSFYSIHYIKWKYQHGVASY